MPRYQATHVPYGITDPAKRTIVNPGIKDKATFTKCGIETGGEYFLVRTVVHGGGEVPLHRHYTYGETFYPIQGTLGVVGHNGTKTVMLSPESGETYTVKPGEWHRFFNPSQAEDIIFDAKVTPAHQGFEKNLFIFYGLVEDGYGNEQGFPKSLYHLMMLGNIAEVGWPGVSGWAMGLLQRFVGWHAWVTGEEERLTVKYYGRPITAEERRKWKVD